MNHRCWARRWWDE